MFSNLIFSKWQIYTITAEEPLNLRWSAAGSKTVVILVVKKIINNK